MSSFHGCRAALCFVAGALTHVALAGVNAWTPVGPDGGRARAVAFHPTQANVALAAAGQSIYRSTDSGQSWTSVRDGVADGWTRIVFDPASPSRVVVSAGDRLWRSDDGGLSFNAALGPASGVAYQTLAAAPANSGSVLYTPTTHGNLFRSYDFGSTWQELSPGLPSGDFIRDLAVDAQNPATIYALTYLNGLYRSTNAGDSWTQASTLTNPSFKVAVDPGDSTHLLLAAYGGVFSSDDSGASWTLDEPGSYSWVGFHPSSSVGAAIAIGDQNPVLRRASRNDAWSTGVTLKTRSEDAAFDSQHSDVVNSRLLLASAAGPLLTEDGGASYTVLSAGIRASDAYALAADSVSGNVYAAFAAGPLGVHRRTASGWTEVDNAELLARIPGAFQPLALAAHGDTLFVGSGVSLVRSLDAGQTWSAPHPGLGAALPRALAFAPSNPQILYLANDGQGVFRSGDQGVTWLLRTTGAPQGVSAIAIDPLDPDIAYAGDRYGGGADLVYKTTNGGGTWAPASAGIASEAVDSLVVTPTNGDVLYAGGGGNGEGLFKSIDGGTSWQRVGAPAGDDPGVSVAIDPVVTTNLVMAFNSSGSAARSVDAGATWEELPFPPPPSGFPHLIRIVTLDPGRPHFVIGSANGYGLVEFEVSPDLEVVVSSAPATLPLDGLGSATIRVRNGGPFAASAVQMQLTEFAGATLESVTPAQGACALVNAVLTCDLGVLRVDQTVDTTLALRAGSTPISGVLSANVRAHESDAAPADNSATTAVATTRIADLGVALEASAGEVDRGTSVVFTATVSNDGPNASEASELVLTLDNDFGYLSVSHAACTESGGSVTCALDPIDAGQQLVVSVEALAEGLGTLGTAAGIISTALDPVAGNDTATVNVMSRPVADVSVLIADAADPAVAGQTLQYSATVANAGPDELPTSTVTIAVVGASITNASSDRGSCTTTSANATCTLTNVPSGSSATIQIATRPGAAGTATASANVTFAGTDPTSTNNSASQSTTVNAPPSSGGGGGGGAAGWLELLTLTLALVLVRTIRRHERLGVHADRRPAC